MDSCKVSSIGSNLSERGIIEGSEEYYKFCSYSSPSDAELEFYAVVERGDKSAVEEILKRGIDIDAPSKDGLTALMMAVIHENESIVKLLLEHGACVVARRLVMSDRYDHFELEQTVLHFAIKFAAEDIVKLLLTVEPCFEITSNEVFEKVISYAVRRKNSKILKHLFRGKDINELEDSIKNVILAKEIPTIDILDKYDDSALLLAIMKKKHYIAKWLLEKGARIQRARQYTVNKHMYKWCSMLHVAVISYTDFQDEEIIRLLSNYCDINETTKNGFTALHIAVRDNKLQLVRILVSLGADINGICTSRKFNGLTALRLALEKERFEIFKYFLNTEKVSQENFVSTASVVLYHAFFEEYINVMLQSFLRNGSKCPENITAALHLAIVTMNQEVIDSILNCNSNANQLKWEGMYPIHRAANCDNIYCLNRLLDLEGDIDIRDELCRLTALDCVIEKANIPIILLLLSKGADIKSVGDACIHCNRSVKISNGKVIELLLDAHADFKVFRNSINEYTEAEYILPISRHVIKLEAAKMIINPNYLYFKNSDSVIKADNFASDCIEEIDKLKKKKISESSTISYHHFLSNNVCRLANYTRNAEITSKFNSDYVEHNFPIYGQMIIISYGRALKRLELIQNLENLLFDVLCNLPFTFIREIQYYFSDNELKTMFIDNKNNK